MSVTLERPPPDQPYYAPQGRMSDLWDCRGVREVIISGPAGTGKSRGILEYLYVLANLHKHLRILIARLTRKSLTETTLVTFEEEVVPGRPGWLTNQKRRVRQSYELPNGSEIVCGGLDDTTKIMSSQYDVIYIPETREVAEDAWEDLMSRLRNGRLPWQQIIGDTNPDAPTHWILERERRGGLKLIETRHDDNPRYWDARANDWTDEGRSYVLGTLERLTGVRKLRLRDGKWVGAENMVYPDWDTTVHVIDSFPLQPGWTRYRVIDFGMTNPFCCQWWAEDGDGRLYRYRELYGTQTKVVDWAHLIHDLTGREAISATITDHDVEARASLEAHMGHTEAKCPDRRGGVREDDVVTFQSTRPANKAVSDGIQKVSARLMRAGDGEPRLFLFNDALVERDEQLVSEKKPTCTEEEFPRYVWDKATSQRYGEVLLEQPLKKHDHGMDCTRYMVMHVDGNEKAVREAYQEQPKSEREQFFRGVDRRHRQESRHMGTR